MIDLLKWALFPGAMLVYRIGDDGGGGGSGSNDAEEEARKAALRTRIDRLYGVNTKMKVQHKIDPATGADLGLQEADANPNPWSKLTNLVSAVSGESGGVPTGEFEVDDPEAIAAQKSMEGENTKLGDATRSYYTDQLGRDYAKAERGTRFKLARQGLLGGSEDIYQQGDVKSDRDLGATRVDESVRRAIAGLTTQREQERLNAIGLVNSGSGDSAVSAAQAGLRNSLDNANSAQKADLFGDLFANSADAMANSNIANQQAALAGRFRDRLSTFFPARGTTSGRVTPSA